MSQDSPVDLTVHMLVSLDGKTTGRLFESPHFENLLQEYYRIDRDIFIPSTKVCMSGRKCIDALVEVEALENFPASDRPGDRSDFHADLDTVQLGEKHHFHAVIDPHGRVAYKQNIIHCEKFPYYNGDRPVEVLVEDFVSDNFLGHLRKVNVPYIFAGKSALDCKIALEKLSKLFKTNHVVCHGGGTLNGTLQTQGLVKHLSLIVVPVVSGDPADVPLFKSITEGGKVPMSIYTLDASERVGHSGVWLRYTPKV